MLTMKTGHFLVLLLVFSLSECLILPLIINTKSDKCDQQSKFKSIECVYSGIEMYTIVKFGPIDNPQLCYTIKLMIDSGSSVTWLITNDTKLMNPDGTPRTWEDTFVPTINALHYVPQARDSLNISENPRYLEGSSATVHAYANQQLEFDQLNGEETIKVPIDLYFAEEYIIPDSITTLNENGLLALALSRKPKDLNNLFLYQFLEAYPDYAPMMSFDINWDHGVQQTSCFGLGESLPVKNDLLETLPLWSFSNDWVALYIYDFTMEFPNGKRIMIRPQRDRLTIGKMYYLNTTHIRSEVLCAATDTGNTNIALSDYFLGQMDAEEQEKFNTSYTFKCRQYKYILPEIKIGFLKTSNERITITIPASKLYRIRADDPRICHTLLEPFTHININSIRFVKLGLPFFASVYLEMHLHDTRKIENWGKMDFEGRLVIGPK